MSKFAACILIGVMVGLLCGFFGIPIDNYELQESCYMPIEKPEWNLFWNCFGMAFAGIFIFGIIGLLVGYLTDDY